MVRFDSLASNTVDWRDFLDAIPHPTLYDDSTHQVWFLRHPQQSKILKRLNHHAPNQPFWRGMKQLFGVDIARNPALMPQTVARFAKLCSLDIAQIHAASASEAGRYCFLLVSALAGETPQPGQISPSLIVDLAQHLAHLHQHTFTHWGGLLSPYYSLDDWGKRLRHFLWQQGGDASLDHNAWLAIVEQAGQIQPTASVPMIMDLRWDQFLMQDGHLTSLLDLDALVLAPVELDWIILEYMLDEAQARLFKQAYQRWLPVPELSAVRAPYRLLLQRLQVLGAQDCADWLAAPVRF
jgi:hypothetical protein